MKLLFLVKITKMRVNSSLNYKLRGKQFLF
jgi:hypothetical protein